METRLTAHGAICRLLCRILLATLLVASPHAACTVTSPKPLFTDEERRWINAHPVVHVAVEPNWHPIEYMRHGEHAGLVAGYLNAISRVSGLTFETVPGTQWRQAFQALQSHKVDLMPAVWRELASERLGDKVLISTPYLVGRMTAVTRNNSAMTFSLQRLAGKRVAIKGHGAVEYFTRRSGVDLDVLTFDTEALALAAVANGEADAALGIDVTILPILRRQFRGQLYMSGMLADQPVSLAMATRADMPILASIINKSLTSIPVSETAAMTRNWVELADYGKPTIRSILHYRAPQVLAIGVVLLAFAMLAYLSWKSRSAAIRSERDKAIFLAFISHEIRTPMHTVLSSLELLQRSRLTGQQASRANAAISASETLLTLLDDILGYSRLESCKVTLAPQPVELSPWAQQSVDMVRWRADEKGLALVLDVACPPSLTVVIDPVRVRQIVLNLLVNAIKFTSDGSVTLRIDYLPGRHGQSGTLMLQVRDTGIGISPERREHIFDAYWQAEHSPHYGANGSGLGLAICRELVELMRGTIAADSTPHVDTTMTVRLPTTATIAHAPAAFRDAHAAAGIAPVRVMPAGIPPFVRGNAPRILVVDDHETVQFSLRQQCDELGCEAVTASTGKDALQQISAGRFDMVLLDCNLPDLDGYAVARLIRQGEAAGQTEHVPIIAISASADDAHKVRCFESGMDGVLGKPLRLDTLRQMIEMWCPARTNAALDAPVGAPRDDNGDMAAALRAVYLRTLGEDLDALATALISRDIPAALHTIHRIKGASHIAGFKDIAEMAERLEARLREIGDERSGGANASAGRTGHMHGGGTCIEAPAPE